MADLIPPLFKSPEDYRLYFIEEVENGRIPRDPVGAQEKQGMHNAFKGKKSGPIIKQKHSNLLKEAEKIDDIANRRTESPKSTTRILSLKDLAFDNRAGEGTPKQPTQRNLFDDSSPTQPRLPTPQATEEEPVVNAVNPNQQSFSFGETAQDFRSDAEVQKELLTKIFDTLFDISKNVSLMAEGFPDLLEASKSVDKLKDTNNLKKEEEDREALGKRLKGNLADAGMSLVSTGFGFFEKLFAILTPFIAGFLLSFTDLLDPVKLLKQALLLLSAFIVGKLIYQLGKAVTFTLLERLKEKFISGPKVINAPNSVINAGSVGTGTGGVVTTGTGDTGGKKKPGGKPTGRFGRFAMAGTALFSAGAIAAATPAAVPAGAAVVPAGAAAVPAGAPAATGALSKMKGLISGSKAIPILGTILTLASAPFQYMSKRDEGKTKFRAGTETAASVTGILGGAAAGAALGTAIGGPIGTVIGGAIGAYGGEKLMSSITEGLFNFFTGTESNKMSVFSEEFAKLSKEEQLKIRPSDSEAQQLKNIYKVESLQSFTTEDLLRAQKDIITAREKDPAKASNQNFVVSKGGDTTNNKIINVPALEAEISRRGLPSGGLGAK
jgi:hypothetical protein